jgi:hypothetical protein
MNDEKSNFRQLFSRTKLSKTISEQRKSTINYAEQMVGHFFKIFSEAWSGDEQTMMYAGHAGNLKYFTKIYCVHFIRFL